MPDADIVHDTLPSHYKKLYKQICEWHWSPEDLRREALIPLKKDIKKFGTGPIDFLSTVESRLDDLASSPLFLSHIDWIKEREYLEQVRHQYRGSNLGLDLALAASKEKLEEIRMGNHNSQPVLPALIVKYLSRIYQASFEDRVLLTPDHYDNVSPDIIQERINILKPFVEEGIEIFASQIAGGKDLSALLLPPPVKKGKVNLETDVLSFK